MTDFINYKHLETCKVCNGADVTNSLISTGCTKPTVTIRPGSLTLSELRFIYQQPVNIVLDRSAYGPIERSAALVAQIVKENRTTYGINTGIGMLASVRIDRDDLEILQKAIVLSHATGIGDAAEDNLVRLILVLKINSLSRGFSGVRRIIVDSLIAFVNADIYPHVPVKGSVGASGDLAPLSHISSVLLGEGKARCNGEWISAMEALSRLKLEPIVLAPKEGVALINGAQVSAAFALRGLFAAEDLYAAATVCGSLTVEAALGSRSPFDKRVHELRGQQGQVDAAAAYRHLLGERSELSDTHRSCSRVQDPYSLRCQPQVMGACLTQIRHAAQVLVSEANAVSDNPLIFADEDVAISAANFHAEPTAMAADNLALALAEIGSISERRIALLMDKQISLLPGFLIRSSGLFSGFMTSQATAAALASENKSLAHPASVDSIPTSANQEDHVSMAPYAGRRLWQMADNVRGILAIEWLSACQGLDLRTGLLTTDCLEEARKILRKQFAFYENDRFFSPDIDAAIDLLASGCMTHLLPASLLPSL